MIYLVGKIKLKLLFDGPLAEKELTESNLSRP